MLVSQIFFFDFARMIIYFLQKLIKRTIFTDHTKLLVQRQDALLTELKRQAEEGFPKAEEEWEKSVVTWGKCLKHRLLLSELIYP